MKCILCVMIIALCSMACNDWLDVRPSTEQKEGEQFTSVNGFFDALTGCYMTMADEDAYGERLSMSNIESLANLWELPDNHERLADYELARHDYTKDNARKAVQAIYAKLFEVIVQANMIIKYTGEKGDVFTDTTMLKMVEGEAYAIRAYCQFDILRLFGQMPGQNSSRQVELPYSFTTSIYEMPAYYGWEAYIGLLKDDIVKALELLKEGDPIFEYTFAELNGKANVANRHQLYRQSRLNYWAVKALEARVLLYIGDETGAYAAARAVIDAVGPDGNPVMKLSGSTDIAAKYMACPNECLFYISKFDLHDKAQTLLIGGSNESYTTSNLAVSEEMFNQLYADMSVYFGSHNRYNNAWGNSSSSSTHDKYRTVLKYYWDDEKANNKMLYYQIIPQIRMSEIYLIAMETAALPESNALFKEYMQDRGVSEQFVKEFASKEEVCEFMPNEYRREFYAEGQMFYTYKRFGLGSILWYSGTVDENLYILPLPQTEFNPNNL